MAKPKSPVVVAGVLPQSSFFVGSPNTVSFLVRNESADPVTATANLVVKAKKFSRTVSTQIAFDPGAESSAAVEFTPEVAGKHSWKICIEGGRCSKKLKTVALETPPPSATEIIQGDLEAGNLDYATSLIYRAWALVGDERLPEEYRASLGHESLLIDEIRQALPDLNLDAQAQLAPMLLRPNNPASPWSSGTGATASRAVVAAEEPPAAPDACKGSWDRSDDGNTMADTRFLVWACKDATSKKDIAWAVEQFKYFWAPETAAMQRQIPGDGGDGTYDDDPDDRVDIHLLPQGALLRNSDRKVDALGLAAALDVEAPTSSTYIVIDRSLAHTRAGVQTVAHELFHAVQNAFGAAHLWQSHALEPGETIRVSHWSLEASAVWAEAHFSPGTSVGREGSRGTYTRWYTDRYRLKSAPGRKDAVAGLNWPAGRPPAPTNAYASFIWFYFLEQERDVAGIRQVWNALSGSTFGTADGAMAGVMSFADNFEEFALRTVNVHLPGAPIDDLFDALPGTRFETATADSPMAADAGLSAPVPFVKTYLAPSEDPHRFPDLIPPLGVHFYSFVPETKTRSVTFDVSELQPSSAVALLKIDDEWVRRDFNGNKLDLCLDREADKFEEAFIVVGNRTLLTQASGAFIADARDSCVNSGSGTVTIHETVDSETADSDFTYALNLRMRLTDGAWVDDGGTWTMSGTTTTNAGGEYATTCLATTTFEGSGTFVSPEQSDLSPGEGTFSFSLAELPTSEAFLEDVRVGVSSSTSFSGSRCPPPSGVDEEGEGGPGYNCPMDDGAFVGSVTTDESGNQVADMACSDTKPAAAPPDDFEIDVTVTGQIPLTGGE